MDGSMFSGIFHATNGDKDFGMSGKLKYISRLFYLVFMTLNIVLACIELFCI